MIIAGPCLFKNDEDTKEIYDTAKELVGIADIFRCKIWGGGTQPDKFIKGIGEEGLKTLDYINHYIMPVMTEIQTPDHIKLCEDYINHIWIGARNSQNYGLLLFVSNWIGDVFLKRGAGMTIKETIGLSDIMRDIFNKEVYIIERGLITFDRHNISRWAPDLRGVIELKIYRPDIFNKLVIDCSHSVGDKAYIEDCYKAFAAIGCENFMFECTSSGKSETDKWHMLSVKELKDIICG